ncbi:MAG: recombination-associated protein RdgC [Deltaproteobacteria bacterium]|nr:recombination-associated protein RdgC [Deltaproteobacteria bacterium]
MGFLKGTITFAPFRVIGEDQAGFNNFFDEQIKKFAFPDFTGEAEEKIAGWTDIADHLDRDFAEAKYAVGGYLLFSLRMDRKAAPPSLLKIRCLEAERDALKERNIKRINRALRDEIKERILHDLLKKSQPIPSFYDICWNPLGKRLFFSGLADKVVDDFHGIFKETFNFTLQPFYPWDPACLSAGQSAKLQSLEGVLWGRDFLTWLWYKSEERNGSIAFSPQEEVELVFTRRIVLASGDGDYAEQIVCQGLHAGLLEGKEALRQGKKIKEARVRLAVDADVFEFTFKADRFHLQSLKLPETLDDEDDRDADGKTLERLYLIERPFKTMERLFGLYLDLRLSPQWDADETPRMNKWLERL